MLFRSGIEAAASTGGQIMPPLMGAGAFLIAEYTRVPYLEVVKVSILPAILYFATVYLFVHIIALKQGMQGMAREELPQMREVICGISSAGRPSTNFSKPRSSGT